MDATIIIAIVPVVLLVAYIIWLVRAKITEGRDIDLREPITGVVICLVAVLIIGSMTASTVTYTYSEETNTLYINQNLIDSNQPFDSYGDEIKSVVIGNNCRLIETGTLDSLTNLEYVSIGKNVEVRNGAFGVTFMDDFGGSMTVSDLSGADFVGTGDGTLFAFMPEIFTYNGSILTGLASGYSDPVSLVLPKELDGTTITSLTNNVFKDSLTLEKVLSMPGASFSMGYHSFEGCTSLTTVVYPSMATISGISPFVGCTALEDLRLPASLETIEAAAFKDCSSLASVELPASIKTIDYQGFYGCTALEDLRLPASLETIGNGAFNSCTSITSFEFPATMTSILGYAFTGCTGVTEIAFASGFAPTLGQSWQGPWKFYAADGTTQLDATDPANLAGKTFQGTVNALVELAPGQLTLTPLQFQQVQLHTQELQDQELDLQPLPFQPAVQTQDQEPVSA